MAPVRKPSTLSRETVIWIAIAILWAGLYTVVACGGQAWHDEERPTGNVARGLVEGLVAPIWYYQYVVYGPGVVVHGVILAPIYALLGSSLLWIKLLGAVFAAAGTAVWIALVRRGWGLAPALLLAVWFLAPPPYLGQIQHIAWANHMESIFWSGWIVLVFLHPPGMPSPGRAAVLGLLIGFASFYCMQNVIPGLAIAATAVLSWGRRGALRVLWPALPCFALGFFPHWLAQWQTGGRFAYLSAGGDLWSTWRDLAMYAIPRLGKYSWAAFSWAFAGLAVAALAGAALETARCLGNSAALSRRDRRLACVLVIWAAGWFVAAGLSRFEVKPRGDIADLLQLRYLVPLLPVGMALVCHVLARLPRRAGWVILTPLLIAGATSLYPASLWDRFVRVCREGTALAEFRKLRGDGFTAFVMDSLPNSWEARKGESIPEGTIRIDRAVRSISRLAPTWRPLAYEALGARLGPSCTALLLREGRPELTGWASELAFGAGSAAAACPRRERRKTACAESDRDASSLLRDEATLSGFAEGLGFGVAKCGIDHPSDTPSSAEREALDENRRIVSELPPAALPSVVRGAARMNNGILRQALLDRLNVPDTDQTRTAWDEGWADGFAIHLLDWNNCFAWPESENDRRLLRQAFDRRGIAVRPTADPNCPVAIE